MCGAVQKENRLNRAPKLIRDFIFQRCADCHVVTAAGEGVDSKGECIIGMALLRLPQLWTPMNDEKRAMRKEQTVFKISQDMYVLFL